MIRTPWKPSVLLATALLAACAAPAEPPAAGAVRPVLRKSTAVNTGVQVASYARMNAQCEASALPRATITAEPPHGTLTARPASVTMGGRVFEGTARCRDRTVEGIEMWYLPDPGYRGTDPMAWTVDTGAGPLPFRATVDVR